MPENEATYETGIPVITYNTVDRKTSIALGLLATGLSISALLGVLTGIAKSDTTQQFGAEPCGPLYGNECVEAPDIDDAMGLGLPASQ